MSPASRLGCLPEQEEPDEHWTFRCEPILLKPNYVIDAGYLAIKKYLEEA
jgi:hypothetical protein